MEKVIEKKNATSVGGIIGKSPPRADAQAKVTGKAKYTADFFVEGMLVGKVLRSPHAHARVRKIDPAKAEALPGVEAVLTPFNVPQHLFPTAGHPYALDPAKGDVADKTILTAKARFVGDEIAAVVAVDQLTAAKALELIEVEYEVLEPVFSAEAALQNTAPLVHEERGSNLISDAGYKIGEYDSTALKADHIFKDTFETAIVQHCAMENHLAYAYQESDGRLVIVSSTQIPHICRRIVGQALGIPWGQIRIIKPYVGGGFGSKQDACLEPLVAAMTLAVGGRPVKLELTREESMTCTRTRHSTRIHLETAVNSDGKLLAIKVDALSNTGAYASHGHSVIAAGGSKFKYIYLFEAISFRPCTVYTNLPVAGAMRAYGSPQIAFALESHLDNIARNLAIDPVELRLKNLNRVGYRDPHTGNQLLSCGLPECIERGKELIEWDRKKAEYEKLNRQGGHKRYGLGMACFSYATGTYPACLEVAGARIVLNQDGSIQLQLGATEIGQGSDTVLAQMAADTIGIPYESVHVVSTQDTDVSPFDTGSYASRQTYISGMAVKKAALEIRNKALRLASEMAGLPAEELSINEANILEINSGRVLLPLAEVALHSYYDRERAGPLTSDVSNNARVNAIAFGVSFTAVEVDIGTGQIEVLEIYNVHDSGTIINRQLAEGQVQGGVSMALGYALSEELLFDEKSGRILNNNLLDYKLPTILDTPEIGLDFIETFEPTGPFGNKALGEPPVISPAPAVRNAIFAATGVAINRIPIRLQVAFEHFKAAGLIKGGG